MRRSAAADPPSCESFDLGSDLAKVKLASYLTSAIAVLTLVVNGLNGVSLPLRRKVVVLVFEQDIEGRQGAIATGDVLLHLHLLRIGQLFMRVYFLFEHAQVISEHDDFVADRN